ncbi:MAG TPA: hypothetical protein PLO15_04865 [Propionicimonas sp.]|nr:hypothetical protein [Propionicimonas sp.]
MEEEVDALLRHSRSIRSFVTADGLRRRREDNPSSAYQEAAENLLLKAWRELVDDPGRAVSYVERALRLPFDPNEDSAPAAYAAHMLLFNLVVDALEDSEEGEEEWLAAAIQVLNSADPRARSELRDVLEVVAQDYHITSSERRKLAAAVKSAPPRQSLFDLQLPPDELCDHIVAVLHACEAYETALDEIFA